MTQTPTSIGKYDVEGVVGEGAMGVVYRATDRVLNRRVAIKVMSDAIAKDTDLRERFLREAQAAGSLQHPNVVTIYDFGEVDDHLYIAMEYVEGDDLEDLLARRVRLPLDGRLGVIIDVLQGLAFAHKRGIVHRDIKPANIRIDSEGRARLMDFGIAHLDSAKITRTGTMLGTPSYMAPEQILGGEVTPAADIFSTGAVLYELLTGTRPFQGESLQSLMYQVLSVSPAPLQKVDPLLPGPLNNIVMRALQKAPGDRYASALDMASDLTNVRSTLLPNGGRSSLSLRATIDSALALRTSGIRERARRRRNYFAAGALATVAIVALALQLTRQASGGAPSESLESTGPSAAAGITDTAPPVQTMSAGLVPGDPTTVTAAPPAPAPETVEPQGPTAAEVASARRTQTEALTSRARALAAGATAQQLRAGDAHNEVAETRLAQNRVAEAQTYFGRAAASWRTAERSALEVARERAEAARVAAAQASSSPAPSEVQASMPPATVPVAPQPVLQQQPVAAEPPAPAFSPPQPPADHRADIAAVVATYAQALESRDIARLQRAYPGMTTTQRRAFEDFFRETRSLDVVLAVSSLQVDGTTAQANLTGTYNFVTSAGSTERRPANFQAVLRQEQGSWRLTSVR